jgi:mannosyltransferase
LTSWRIGLAGGRIRIDPAVAALAILGLVLAFVDLGSKSLVMDEATSVDYARRDLHVLQQIVTGSDPNQSLYYVLLHGWVKVFGESEVAVRSLSAIFAGLAVAVVTVLGTRLFGRPAGLLAGLLLALDGFFVRYAQTARAYSLVVLLVALSCYFFVAELEQPSRRNRVGFVLASALAFYAHYFAVYVLLVQALTLLAVKRRAAFSKDWLIAAAGVVILCAPEVVLAVQAGTGGISWISEPSLDDLLHLPTELLGGSRLLAWAVGALGLFALLRALGEGRTWPVGFVAAWFGVPVLLAFAISFHQPMFIPYSLIVSLPALVLLAAAGLVRLPNRVAGAIALAVLLVFSSVGLCRWYERSSVEDFRGATSHIGRTMRPGDGIVCNPACVSGPFEYYERRSSLNGPTVVGFQGVKTRSRHPPRVWLVMRDSDTSSERRTQLEKGLESAAYAHVEGRRFNNLTVLLYRARAAG